MQMKLSFSISRIVKHTCNLDLQIPGILNGVSVFILTRSHLPLKEYHIVYYKNSI